MNWPAFWLSVQTTSVATVIIVVLGTVIASMLMRHTRAWVVVIETLILVPLVLPPSVIGYYLLLGLGAGSPLVVWFDIRLLFSWWAIVIAQVVVGLPLMVQASRAALAGVPTHLREVAQDLGARRWQVWWRITVPLAWRGLLAGSVLGGARALGEFGTTLMISGNIPGMTQTFPVAIYDAVQAQRYNDAHVMVIVMTVVSFVGLYVVRHLEYKRVSSL
jgi:molybdate transport system permease protein